MLVTFNLIQLCVNLLIFAEHLANYTDVLGNVDRGFVRCQPPYIH